MEAARAAAEGMRTLNRVTISRDGYACPADVAAVLGELALVVQRLPQTFDQAARWLETAQAEGRVGHDGKGHANPNAVAAAVAQRLNRASAFAERLDRVLSLALQNVAHLTEADPPRPV
jgi:hypothetical protein